MNHLLAVSTVSLDNECINAISDSKFAAFPTTMKDFAEQYFPLFSFLMSEAETLNSRLC